uniref:G_PROTEIN_RECEP_F1_2 domain-containing protein n=1 Tax=Panagrellus redivivus TaxID=6233 RepID=A0A7E4UZ73_PANRE
MDFDSYLWPAVPAITVMLIIYLFGLFGNIMVVITTFRSKTLSTTCNVLIAFESIASTVHVTAHWYLGFLIYSGINDVPLQQCAIVMTVPIIGLCSGNIFVMMTAVDRVFMIIAPIRYQTINKTYYIVSCCLLGLAFSAYILVVSHLNASNSPNVNVVCFIVEAMHGTPYNTYSTISMVIMFATFGCYVVIFIILKLQNRKADKFFKPLIIMISIVFFSWLLTAVSMIIASTTNNGTIMFYTPLYVGITVNISCASNFYVLYFMSGEYRQSFKSLLYKMTGLKLNTTTVSVMSVSHTNKTNKSSARS